MSAQILTRANRVFKPCPTLPPSPISWDILAFDFWRDGHIHTSYPLGEMAGGFCVICAISCRWYLVAHFLASFKNQTSNSGGRFASDFVWLALGGKRKISRWVRFVLYLGQFSTGEGRHKPRFPFMNIMPSPYFVC